MPFPELVTIEFRTGGIWSAERRWQRGMETGFEYTRFSGLHADAAAEAGALYNKMQNAGVRQVTERLLAVRYFDHAGIQDAAEKAEAALVELEGVLKVAAGLR